MKDDGVLNLLIFQALQDVRMASSLVRSTINFNRTSVDGYRSSFCFTEKECIIFTYNKPLT